MQSRLLKIMKNASRIDVLPVRNVLKTKRRKLSSKKSASFSSCTQMLVLFNPLQVLSYSMFMVTTRRMLLSSVVLEDKSNRFITLLALLTKTTKLKSKNITTNAVKTLQTLT